MTSSAAVILLVLGDGGARAPFGDGGPPPGFRVSRYRSLSEDDLRSGMVRAVVHETDGPGVPASAIQRLRRLAGSDLPLLAFRWRAPRRPAPRRPAPRAAAVPAFRAPLDPALVEALVELQIAAREARQRAHRAVEELRDRDAHLQALAAIIKASGTESDPYRVLDCAMDKVRSLLDVRTWRLLRADPGRGVLTVDRTGGGAGGSASAGLSLDAGIAGRAAQRREPIVAEDGTVLAVPLLSRGRVLGVIEAARRGEDRRFGAGDAGLMALLLEPAAIALDNALLLKKQEELSVTDDLTKLYNARYLNATLRREVERSKRYRTPVSLIFLDLDGFKHVNDRHGHLSGSRALVEVGQVLRATVREIDVVARFGGDEFTVILPQTGPEGALKIAERIRERIAATTFLEVHGLDVRITASLGVASFPDHGRTKDDLLARADQAMYLVKGRGKNDVAVAEMDAPRPQAARTVP